jgi:Protein of unknown function (DUF2635)
MSDEPYYVKPAPGRLVRHPRSRRPIPEEGQDVRSERAYFQRLVRVGDVILVAKSADPAPEAAGKPAPPHVKET